MLAYAGGDMLAFETLYRRHRGALYRFLLRTLRQRADADELFQETWSRVIVARERYRPEAKFTTWLLQIAHNLVIDRFRRQRPQASPEETETVLRSLDAPESEQPERALSEFEQRRCLQLALEELPEEQRVAFLLRVEGGLGLEIVGQTIRAGDEIADPEIPQHGVEIRLGPAQSLDGRREAGYGAVIGGGHDAVGRA